ncbi:MULTISPECIES: DUF3631 domain-containing protein [unclassified Moraxella]|uniref:DUF3631 domain-containing protein n=1 Tax=unclassified Moraxella TaxID=2685852 RepID=UPI003AF89FC7
MNNKPNLEQATRHLNALAPNGGAFTFCTIKGKVTKHYHGTLEQHATQLTKANEQGAGVFVTVNKTDGKGRKEENITAVRGLFLDFDNERGQRTDDLLSLDLFHSEALTPSMIVESSTGKHHAYWFADGIPLDKFSQWQEKLIHHYSHLLPMDKIDLLKDLPRVMRLAGFYHTKGEPVMTRIVYPREGEAIQRYTLAEIGAFIDSLPTYDRQTSQKTTDSKHNDIVSDDWDFTKDEPLGLSVAEIKHYLQYVTDNADYDTWLKMGMILHHEFRGDSEGLNLWDSWSDTAHNYAGYDELAEKWQTFDSLPKDTPITLRTLIKWAMDNKGFKPYQIDITDAYTVIAQLATLDETAYQLQRKEKAKQIGITPTGLDKAVNAERKKIDNETQAKVVDDTEPHTEAVNGNALADEIYSLVKAHIACEDSIAVTATLWIFFTWCIEVAYIAPIAWINAPEKRCGKTQLAKLIGRMSKRALFASGISSASLFRTVDKFNPTFIIDEADSFIKDNEDLRGVINAGFSRDNPYIIRCVGENLEPTPFNVFGAKVISGIGKLPSTITDRSISLTLRRALPTEDIKRLRDLPISVTEAIKSKLARWANDHSQQVCTAKPTLPQSIYNREYDTWEILFQIAHVLGGDWLERVTVACLTITGNEPTEPSLNEQLLMDIKTLFERHSLERISSKDLLAGLTGGLGDEFGEHEPMIWETYNHGKPMSDRQLAKRLKDFGIKSIKIRFDDKTLMGYYKKDFSDAFNRYLPQ